MTKEHGDAFSRQHTRLWQWTFDYGHDTFELGVNREQFIVASGIDDTLFPLLSLHVTFLLLGTRLDNVGSSPWWNVTVSFPLSNFSQEGEEGLYEHLEGLQEYWKGTKGCWTSNRLAAAPERASLHFHWSPVQHQ